MADEAIELMRNPNERGGHLQPVPFPACGGGTANVICVTISGDLHGSRDVPAFKGRWERYTSNTPWVETGAPERTWAALLREYDGAVGFELSWQAADGCIVETSFGKKGIAARRRRPAATRPRQAGHQAPPADRGAGHPGRARRHGANRHHMIRLAALPDGTVVERPRPRRRTWPWTAASPTTPTGTRRRRGARRRTSRPRRARPRRCRRRATPAATRRGAGSSRWFNRCRRLTRTEKRAHHDLGFGHVAATLIVSREVGHARPLSG